MHFESEDIGHSGASDAVDTARQSAIYEAVQCLNRASFEMPFSGMYGATSAQYYYALSSEVLTLLGRYLAWNSFVSSAEKSKNVAVLVRALFDARKPYEEQKRVSGHKKNAMPEDEWSDLMMLQGHLLRRVARDYNESARAYAHAARASKYAALASNIALMRIQRAEPQCEEIRAALNGIRQSRILRFEPKSDIEARLARLKPEESEKRTQTKIELATAILLDWGDVATALDWLEDAHSDNPEACRVLLINTVYAIARACMDHRATLARVVRILDGVQAYREIANLAILTLYIRILPSHKDECDYVFARVCAIERNRSDLAIFYLQKAVQGARLNVNTADWMAIWTKQTWIFDFAPHHGDFVDGLLALLADIEDDNVVLYLLENLQKSVDEGRRCTCWAMRIQRLLAANRYLDALRLFKAFLSNGNADMSNLSGTHLESRFRIMFDVFLDLMQDSSCLLHLTRFNAVACAFEGYVKDTPSAAKLQEVLKTWREKDFAVEALSGRQNTLDIHGFIDELSEDEAGEAFYAECDAPLDVQERVMRVEEQKVPPSKSSDDLGETLSNALRLDVEMGAARKTQDVAGGMDRTDEEAALVFPNESFRCIDILSDLHRLQGESQIWDEEKAVSWEQSGNPTADAPVWGDFADDAESLDSGREREGAQDAGISDILDEIDALSGISDTDKRCRADSVKQGASAKGTLPNAKGVASLSAPRIGSIGVMESGKNTVRTNTQNSLLPVSESPESLEQDAQDCGLESGATCTLQSFPKVALSSESADVHAPQDASQVSAEDAFNRAMALVTHGDSNSAFLLFFGTCAYTQKFDIAMQQLVELYAKSECKNDENSDRIPTWYAEDWHRNSLANLTLANLLDPDEKYGSWAQRVAQIASEKRDCLEAVLRVFLRLLPSRADDASIFGRLEKWCVSRVDRGVACSILIERMDVVLQYDALFEQVLNMSDSNNQRQMLEKLDDAIAMYAGDTVQKNALIAKKYRIADLLGDERIKLTCLRDILETTPNDVFATTELHRIDPGMLKPHAQILYYQLLIYIDTNKDLRLQHQMTLASIYAKSSQSNNAINLYYAILDEQPEYLEAGYQLLNLLESLENWKSAENILLRLINAETSLSMRVQCLLRLADIQSVHMRMPSRALLTLFAAIDADPAKMSVLHEKMCNISEQSKSYSALLDKYEDLSTHAQSYEIRRMATVLLANVCAERVNKPIMACNILDEFFEREGKGDPEYLKVIANFYEEVRHWESYCKAMTALIELTTQPNERTPLALSIAEIQWAKLHDSIRAAQFARLAAQTGSQDPEVWQDIAHYLIQTNVEKDAIDAVDALNQAERLEKNHDKKIVILFEMTRINTQVDRLADAVQAFSRLTALRPPLENLTPIAEDLIALATAHKDCRAFENLCRDLVGCCPKNEQPALLLQQALTLIRVFDDIPSARKILDQNRDNFAHVDPEQSMILVEILTLLDESTEAIETIRRILDSFTLSDNHRHVFLGYLLENAQKIGNDELMRTTAEALLALDPNDSNANFVDIQRCYKTGHWDEAADRIQKFLPHLERLSAEKALELHYYYGVILHAAQNSELAMACLDNALRIRANYKPAVDLKLTILIENQRWLEALPLFDDLLSLSDDQEEQGAIHKRIAEVHHFYLHHLEEAIRHYEIALSLGGDVEDVPIRLLDLYQKNEDWQKAAMTAQVLAMAQTDSPHARASYLMIQAGIQANHMGDLASATNALLEAFLISPLDDSTLDALTKILIRGKDFGNFAGVIDNIARYLDDQSPLSSDEASRGTKAQKACAVLMKMAALFREYAENGAPEERQAAKRILEQISARFCEHGIDMASLENSETSAAPSLHSQADATCAPVQAVEFELSCASPSSDARDLISEISPSMPQKTREATPKTAEQNPKYGVENAVEDKETKNKMGRMPISGLPPLPTKTSSTVNRLFVPITSSSSGMTNALRAIEQLTFTEETIVALHQSAQETKAHLTTRCLNDILDLCGKSHEPCGALPLPDSVTPDLLRNLFSTRFQASTPAFQKLLSVLAQPEFPMVPTAPQTPKVILDDETRNLFEALSKLLSAPEVQLLQAFEADSKCFLGRLQPTAIYCPENAWATPTAATAFFAMALTYARPEFAVTAMYTPVQIHTWMSEAAEAMRILKTPSTDHDPEVQSAMKTALTNAGFSPVTMPRITHDTLSTLHQLAAFNRRMALQNALIFSQSFADTLHLLTTFENIRFPTSLPLLKAAMKQSQSVREFVSFSLSANAQRLYAMAFHHA